MPYLSYIYDHKHSYSTSYDFGYSSSSSSSLSDPSDSFSDRQSFLGPDGCSMVSGKFPSIFSL